MITFSTNFENFKNGLKQVLGATSTVKTAVISNVLLKLYDNKIELVATDGNRIRIKRLKLDATLPEVQEPLKVAFNGEILYNQIKSFKVTDKTLKKVTSAFFEFNEEAKEVIIACPQLQLQKTSLIIEKYADYPKYEPLIQRYNTSDMDFIEMLDCDANSLKVSFTAKYLIDYLKQVDKDSIVTFEIKHNMSMINLFSTLDSSLFEGLMPAQAKGITHSQQWG